MSETDELLKYKELLESGIITQEEFEKKKKEILNPESNIKKEPEQNNLNNISLLLILVKKAIHNKLVKISKIK